MAGHVLLYDADCGFCRWCAAKVLAWDRAQALRPVALQAPEADELLPGMDEETRMRSWHLVEPSGRVHSAGPAFAPLFGLLPGGHPLAAISRRAPRLADRGYFAVADRRDLFGKLVTRGAARRARARIERRTRS